MKKALFLDRDGVINIEKNYLYRIEDFEFIEGVVEACRFFFDREYLLVVVTNQAGIALGRYTESDYEKVTTWMKKKFYDKGVVLTGVYHCPHRPEISGYCSCRKPEPGMLFTAAADHHIDLNKSILVGDKESDIIAAKKAGVGLKALVRSGHPIINESISSADFILNSLKDLPSYLERSGKVV